MTIQEAIKSGKPFKRKHWGIYFWVNEDYSITNEYGTNIPLHYADDILADDWEVKESEDDKSH
jgi:hypothetical protein